MNGPGVSARVRSVSRLRRLVVFYIVTQRLRAGLYAAP